MNILELIAELERQLQAGELSDEDAERLGDLRRQLNEAYEAVEGADGQRMGDDHNDDDGDREGDDHQDDDGQRSADDDSQDGNGQGDDGQRSAADDSQDDDGQRSADDQDGSPGADGQNRAGRRRQAREGRRAVSGSALGAHFKGRRRLPDVGPEGQGSLDHPNIHPNSRVARHDELKDLDLGMYFRALTDPNRFRVAAKRELAWMDRNLGHGFQRSIDDGAYIPFVLLAEHGPKAKQRAAQRALDGVSPEQHLERFMPLAERAYQQLQDHLNGDGERTLTTANTSAGAATSTVTDLARSIMWLTEMDAALERMTVVPGLRGQWQGFYGNAKPAVDWVAEAADITETNPTLQPITREPKTMGMHWSISTRQMQSADTPIAAMIEQGCEDVFRTKFMRAALSGTNVGANFAADANAFPGLLNSGLVETSFGAALANLDRDDMVDARRRLFGDEVDMTQLGWILSNQVASQLEKTRIGGSESVRFVYEDGRIDCGAEKIPAADTVHMGKAGVTAPAVLLQRSAAILLIWGAGILYNALQIPGNTKVLFDLQVHGSFAFMNPKRGGVIKQG